MNRRGFMRSILALGAAPAIVRIENLMPVIVLPRVNDMLTAEMLIRESLNKLHNTSMFMRSISWSDCQFFRKHGYVLNRVIDLWLPGDK